MHLIKRVHSREGLIEFGSALGRAFQDADKAGRRIVCVGGDAESGKSLIALAIDQVFSPDEYPQGLAAGLSADNIMNPAFRCPPGRPVVFNNYYNAMVPGPQGFDAVLDSFAQAHPRARILIAANLLRTPQEEFNYSARGLESERLDMNIYVRAVGKPFERQIEVTVEDPPLIEAFSGLGFAPS
jgi:hypothetical protein